MPEFIDRQMETPTGTRALWYMQGPFVTDAAPEFGHQLKLVPRDIYRVGIAALERWSKANQGKPLRRAGAVGAGRHPATPGSRPDRPQDLPAKLLFGQLLQNTHEGFFSDPQHGGNRGLVGWKLVGFPAPAPTSWTGPTAARSIPSRRWRFPARGLNMATTLKPVDAVVVGFGWTGAILAKELTEAGLNVVALERGENRDTYPDGAYPNTLDELTYNTRGKLFQNLSRAPVSIRHGINDTALPYRQLSAFLPGDGVGGAGLHWSGVHFRIMPEELRLRSHYEERYGKKFIPEGMTIQDYGSATKSWSRTSISPRRSSAPPAPRIRSRARWSARAIRSPPTARTTSRRRRCARCTPRNCSARPPRNSACTPDLPAANASGPGPPYGVQMGPCNFCGFCSGYACYMCIPRPRRT